MKPTAQLGDVVQLTIPSGNGNWAHNLLMIVEDVRAWGVVGAVPTPQGEAPMRVNFDQIKQVWRRVPDA